MHGQQNKKYSYADYLRVMSLTQTVRHRTVW